MLALYSRRLGPSNLMTPDQYRIQLERISKIYPMLEYVVSKDYYGEVVFYPALETNEI